MNGYPQTAKEYSRRNKQKRHLAKGVFLNGLARREGCQKRQERGSKIPVYQAKYRENTRKSCPLYVGGKGVPRLFYTGLCVFIYIPYPLEQGKTGIKTLLLNFAYVCILANCFAKRDTSCLVFPRARPKHRCRLSFLRPLFRWAPCAH